MGGLEVELLGRRARSPFLLAPGPHTTFVGELAKNAAATEAAGWGGLVTKTLTPDPPPDVGSQVWNTPQNASGFVQHIGAQYRAYAACIVRVNGRSCLACTTLVDQAMAAEPLVIEPPTGRQIIRDLVTHWPDSR